MQSGREVVENIRVRFDSGNIVSELAPYSEGKCAESILAQHPQADPATVANLLAAVTLLEAQAIFQKEHGTIAPAIIGHVLGRAAESPAPERHAKEAVRCRLVNALCSGELERYVHDAELGSRTSRTEATQSACSGDFRSLPPAAWEEIQLRCQQLQATQSACSGDFRSLPPAAWEEIQCRRQQPQASGQAPCSNLSGDFRTIPAAAWEKLHFRCCHPQALRRDRSADLRTLPVQAWGQLQARCQSQQLPHCLPVERRAPEDDMQVKPQRWWLHMPVMPAEAWASLHTKFTRRRQADNAHQAPALSVVHQPLPPRSIPTSLRKHRGARPGKLPRRSVPCALLPPILSRSASRDRMELVRCLPAGSAEYPRAAGTGDSVPSKFVPRSPHGLVPSYRRPHRLCGCQVVNQEGVADDPELPPVLGATRCLEDRGDANESSSYRGLSNTERCSHLWLPRTTKLGRPDEPHMGGGLRLVESGTARCTLECARRTYLALNEKMVNSGVAAAGSPSRRWWSSPPQRRQFVKNGELSARGQAIAAGFECCYIGGTAASTLASPVKVSQGPTGQTTSSRLLSASLRT